MAFRTKIGVEGLWNTKKENLKQLQDRLSKTPSRNGSAESERHKMSPQLGGDLRRGSKPPVPPLSRKTSSRSRDKHDSSIESASISSDDIDFITSPQVYSRKNKQSKRHKNKKAHRVSLTITPQPPTVLYAPPPMQPLYMPYGLQFFGMPQQPMPIPVPVPVAGNQVPVQGALPKQSSMKDKPSEQSEEESPKIIRSRRRKAKKVRILDEKEAVDAGTSTDELSSTARPISKSNNKEKDAGTGSAKIEEINQKAQTSSLISASPNNKPNDDNNSTFDWDMYFAPRMAPPLLFPEPDSQSCPVERLSMLSNALRPTRRPSTASASNAGQLTIETSNDPTPYVFQPAAKDLDSVSSGSSPVPKLNEEDRTLAWLTTEQAKDHRHNKKLTPIAEEMLKSYEKLKNETYDNSYLGDDPKLDGELATANQRLSRYFNQLRDLDHFILDQEAKLLDKQHRHVEKKATDIKPIKTITISPRPKQSTVQDFVIATPQVPPPTTATSFTLAAQAPLVEPKPQKSSAMLIEELYSHLDKSKDKLNELKPIAVEEEPRTPIVRRSKEKASPKHKKGSIFDRFSTSSRFSGYLVDAVLDDLLDEILTFEVGRVMQAVSVEAVSALIEKKLTEDLEEKKAFTRKIIERLPSPTEIIEKAMLQTEATVQKIVTETTTVITQKKPESTTPVEDVDLFFRELTLPKASESIVKDVLEVDLKVLAREVILDLSIESVVDDFLINQVVANEMLKLTAEALGEVERRKKRSRRRQMKDALEGPVMHAMLLDICLAQIAQQSLILSPHYEVDVALYDFLLRALLSKMSITLTTRALVAECLPMRRYHEKVVSDIAMDAVVNELIKSLDIDMAEVDDFETGRDFDFSTKTPTYFSLNRWN